MYTTGIALTKDQWGIVKSKAAEVSEALETGTDNYEVELSVQRKLRVRLVGKNYCVDLREFYQKDGEHAPGKKGTFSSSTNCLVSLKMCRGCDHAANRAQLLLIL